MKRVLLIFLLAALLLTGCAGGSGGDTTTEPAEAPAPLELLKTAWEAVPEESRFPSYGGSLTEEIQEGPGELNPADTNTLVYSLLVPADQAQYVAQAASLTHMMNANTFTCGAFRLEGTTPASFAAALGENIRNNPWMCGFPERMVVATLGDNTVVSLYGHEETVAPFLTALTAAYAEQMTVAIDEQL